MSRTANHPIEAMFLARRSPRFFAARAMDEAQMLQLLEAARWAPSASNNQPWRAAYGLRGDDSFAAMAAALNEGNRTWAAQASGLIAWASRTSVLRDGAEMANPWAGFDAGTAWGHLALQAQAMGMISHAMGGFDAAALAAALNLPASHHIHAVIAVGFLGDLASLPEDLRAREVPNGRNAVTTWAARGGFGGVPG